MTKTLIIGLVVLAAGTSAALGISAQAPAPARPVSAADDAVAALVTEVRALRADLSEAAHASLRSQLLVTRIQLQEQRLMHLDRQRSDVTAKRLDIEKTRAMFAGQVKQLEEHDSRSSDPKEREAAAHVVDGVKVQLQAVLATEATLRAEEGALLNSISTEQSRWSDFNSRLDELERSLPNRK